MRTRIPFSAIFVTLLMFLLTACTGSGDATDPTATSGQSFVVTPDTVATVTASDETAEPAAATHVPVTTSTASPTAPTSSQTPLTETAAAETPVIEGSVDIDVEGHTVTLSAGFTISVFAGELGRPRFMAYDDSGVLHVTDRDGRVLRLPDDDGDGQTDRVVPVAYDLDNPHGITFHAGVLYVAEQTRVVRIEDANSDGMYESPIPIIEGLPSGGHWSRTIRFGPDGKLYVSIGSSCNVCEEDDPLRAAIWRHNADGTSAELFAEGLRNAVGIAFHPETGELWATNNGRDQLGDDLPPETLNQVDQGDDFGWPYCHAGDVPDPEFGGEGACEGVAPPAVKMQAHSAPLGLTFYDAERFGAAVQGDAFIAFHGSWNRTVPTGYKVVHIPFENGQPTGEVNDFATGWLLDNGDYWGRPVDVIVAPDGSMMVSDDFGGRIYRISRQS